jgi:hypothetical protein
MDEQSYLYYNDEENMFYDECGFPVFNIFSIISPNTLRLFIEYGEDMLAYTIDGGCVGLIWEKPTSDNHHEKYFPHHYNIDNSAHPF